MERIKEKLKGFPDQLLFELNHNSYNSSASNSTMNPNCEYNTDFIIKQLYEMEELQEKKEIRAQKILQILENSKIKRKTARRSKNVLQIRK